MDTAVNHEDARGVRREPPPLQVRGQATVADLLGDHGSDVKEFEASGVTKVGDRLLVVSDEHPMVVSFDLGLTPGAGRIVEVPSPETGYEDIAHDAVTGRIFAVIEDLAHGGGRQPKVHELAGLDVGPTGPAGKRPKAALVDSSWVDVQVPPNKGIEGLTCVRRGGELYLLGLLEDTGRIVVLRKGNDIWEVTAEITLPSDLHFEDYAALSIRVDPLDIGAGDRIAVVSQKSSELWIGRLDPAAWKVSNAGHKYRFPTDYRGNMIYANVEGVAWLDDTTLAAVSDIPDSGDPPEWFATAASVHIFAIPSPLP